ncbi:unnamed protein product [marine sediment metagenome]|uniref:DNA translocase FtsK 4TM region domain-containing protein n=1 Tax=marine sediment metagenome TaxID=412755 RepID=X1NUJ8_9ZZZZ
MLDNPYLLSINGAGGGLSGYYFANSLYLYFGTKGAYLVLISLGLISALFITEISYFYIFGNLGNKTKMIFNNIYSILKDIRKKISKSSRRKEELDYKEYEKDEIPKKIFKIKRTRKKEKKLGEEKIIGKDYQVSMQESKTVSYQVPPLSLLSNSFAEEKTDTKLNIKENVFP